MRACTESAVSVLLTPEIFLELLCALVYLFKSFLCLTEFFLLVVNSIAFLLSPKFSFKDWINQPKYAILLLIITFYYKELFKSFCQLLNCFPFNQKT